MEREIVVPVLGQLDEISDRVWQMVSTDRPISPCGVVNVAVGIVITQGRNTVVQYLRCCEVKWREYVRAVRKAALIAERLRRAGNDAGRSRRSVGQLRLVARRDSSRSTNR